MKMSRVDHAIAQFEAQIAVLQKCIDQLRGLRTTDRPLAKGGYTGETRRKRSTVSRPVADKAGQWTWTTESLDDDRARAPQTEAHGESQATVALQTKLAQNPVGSPNATAKKHQWTENELMNRRSEP